MKGICNSIGKPDEAHASALRRLFPSSTSVPRKRCSTAFDPMQDCVFLSEKKKKKAARKKPTRISIIVVKDIGRGVPRGNYKQQLVREERVVKAEVHRAMKWDQVKSTILTAITHLNITDFKVLECVNGQKLVEAENASPDGNAIVESTSRRKGATLYISQVASCSQVDENISFISQFFFELHSDISCRTIKFLLRMQKVLGNDMYVLVFVRGLGVSPQCHPAVTQSRYIYVLTTCY